MKFEVYKENKEEDTPTVFRIEKDSDGDVRLDIIDRNCSKRTDGGVAVLYISSRTGQIYRAHGVSQSIGLDLDDKGRVVVAEND